MKRWAKHRLSSFCDYLRHGRRVVCNVDMTAAQRHAHRPDTLSAILKAACTFPNGVQAAFLGVQRTCLLSRGRGSGFAVAAKGQPAFCGQCPNPICRLLFQIGSKSVPSPQPSPTGEGVGFQLPSEDGLHLNMTAKCRLPLPRTATLSVAMAAQRHADRSDSEIYLIERKCYSGLK